MCSTTRHAYDARRSRKMSDCSPKNMIITLGLMISTKSPVSSLRQTLHHQDRSTDSCIGVIEVQTVRHQFDSAEMSWVRSVLGPKCLDTSPSLCFILFCRYSIYVVVHSWLNKLTQGCPRQNIVFVYKLYATRSRSMATQWLMLVEVSTYGTSNPTNSIKTLKANRM